MIIHRFIRFDGDVFATSCGKDVNSTIDRDLPITATPFSSSHPLAPTHSVYAKSPGGHDLEVGGIWKKDNAEGRPYYAISIKQMRFNANLGHCPNQDDPTLQAIIEWEQR